MMTPSLMAKLALENPQLLASALAAKGAAPPAALPAAGPAAQPQAPMASGPRGPLGPTGLPTHTGAVGPAGAAGVMPGDMPGVPMPGGMSLGDAIAGVKPSIAATRPYAAAVAPGGANFAGSDLSNILALILQNQQQQPVQVAPTLGSLIGG